MNKKDFNRKLGKIILLTKACFSYSLSSRKIKKIKLKPPIFVVGCGHSGTTLLLAILGSHSKLFDIPFESHVVRRRYYSARIILKMFDWWTKVEKKSRWVEKTPVHVNVIASIFFHCDDAKVIVIRRDGRDVALSIKNRFGDINAGINRWLIDNADADKFLSHPQVLFVKYEDLISDTEPMLRLIFQFIDEDYEPQVLEFHLKKKTYFATTKTERPVSASGNHHNQYRTWQVNQPIFDGRGKWKKMNNEDKELFKELAGDRLIEYGYAINKDW